MDVTASPFPPPKPRPRAWWFVVGAVLIVVGAGVGVALFVWALVGFLDTDARVPADGRSHEVVVGTDGERMLWLQQGYAQECQVQDTATGSEVHMRPVSGNFTRSENAYTWIGAYRFDPGSGQLAVTCGSAGSLPSQVLIGPAPRIGSFVVGLVAGIVLPLVLGGAGFLIIVVTTILWVTRPARS